MKLKVIEQFAVKTDHEGNEINVEFQPGQILYYKTPTVYNEDGEAIADTGNKFLQAESKGWMKHLQD